MTRVVFLRSLVAAALIVPGAEPLCAATLSNSAGKVGIVHPLTLQKLEDLEFGGFTLSGAGTAIINPVTNTRSTTGGVIALNGTPHAARFRGAASGGSVVNIKLPNQPVTMTRVGGGATIQLNNFTLDGPSKRVMASSSFFDFRVGGTITIAANQLDGDYVGTFNVTAQYP